MPKSDHAPPAERSARRWAGVPAEDRRAERRRLLLDAALELLGDHGWAGTSVRGVCHAARLNPRYFYESFDDLDALVVALYDELIEELAAAVLEAAASAGDDPVAQTRAALDRMVGQMVDDPRRARVLFVEALGNEELNRRRRETGHAAVATLERLVRRREPDAGPVTSVAAAIVVGGTTELLMAWLDGRIDRSRDELVDEATALFVGVGEAADRLMTQSRTPPAAETPPTHPEET